MWAKSQSRIHPLSLTPSLRSSMNKSNQTPILRVKRSHVYRQTSLLLKGRSARYAGARNSCLLPRTLQQTPQPPATPLLQPRPPQVDPRPAQWQLPHLSLHPKHLPMQKSNRQTSSCPSSTRHTAWCSNHRFGSRFATTSLARKPQCLISISTPHHLG